MLNLQKVIFFNQKFRVITTNIEMFEGYTKEFSIPVNKTISKSKVEPMIAKSDLNSQTVMSSQKTTKSNIRFIKFENGENENIQENRLEPPQKIAYLAPSSHENLKISHDVCNAAKINIIAKRTLKALPRHTPQSKSMAK